MFDALDQPSTGYDQLADFFQRNRRILVVTGAGVSTASGIPDYRDERGQWKQSRPMTYQDFIGSHLARQRYWARGAVGWARFWNASPSPAHRSLARLEQRGHVLNLVTQNVDRLHHRAGSERVINLHGRLDEVICLDCGELTPRSRVQHFLLKHNPELGATSAEQMADGDAGLSTIDFASIKIPSCSHCGGVLKPNVVFFGENVPRDRVSACFASLDDADAVLVVGSSLMVFSGFRFVRQAHRDSKPIASINLGMTRADDLLSLKINTDCGEALSHLVDALES